MTTNSVLNGKKGELVLFGGNSNGFSFVGNLLKTLSKEFPPAHGQSHVLFLPTEGRDPASAIFGISLWLEDDRGRDIGPIVWITQEDLNKEYNKLVSELINYFKYNVESALAGIE